MALFDVKKQEKKSLIKDDKKYSHGFGTPIYEPKNVKPSVFELCDTQKYLDLLKHINKAKVSEDEKKFLRLAASRHIVFNYALIADYYAHSNKEVQSLMEESALVIVDIDKAVENGFVQLSERMEELRNESKK